MFKCILKWCHIIVDVIPCFELCIVDLAGIEGRSIVLLLDVLYDLVVITVIIISKVRSWWWNNFPIWPRIWTSWLMLVWTWVIRHLLKLDNLWSLFVGLALPTYTYTHNHWQNKYKCRNYTNQNNRSTETFIFNFDLLFFNVLLYQNFLSNSKPTRWWIYLCCSRINYKLNLITPQAV